MLNAISKDKTFIIVAMLLAAVIRFDYLFASSFSLDADEAIVGLMAKHIKENHAVPIFYYGQHYMGSLEAIIVASFFELFGVSVAALKVVPLLFSILIVPLIYIAADLLGGKSSARFAALLFAIPPSCLVLWSTKARGGFVEVIFIGLLATIFAMQAFKEKEARVTLTATVGFLLGVGWWVNNQIIYFICPIGMIYLFYFYDREEGYNFFKAVRHFLTGTVSFFIGGIPYWIYNIQNNFVSLEMFKGSGSSDLAKHLEGFVTVAFPMLLGARRFWNEQDVFPGATAMAYVLVALVSVLLSLFLIGVKNGKKTDRLLISLVLLLFLATVFIFCFSSFGYLVLAPRYLLPLYVPIFLLIAWVLSKLLDISKILALSVAFLFFSLNILSSYAGGRAIAGEPYVYRGERVSRDHSELISWLSQNKITHVKTNYWIGYKLAFETNEAVTFSIFQTPHQIRMPEYQRDELVFGSPYVVVPKQARLLRKALAALGRSYHEAEASGYVIIYDFEPLYAASNLIDLSDAKVSASSDLEDATNAIDQELGTRWGSGMPQKAGMQFTVTFPALTTVSGFRYELGAWSHDFPRGLMVEGITGTGDRKQIYNPDSHEAVRYFLDGKREKVLFEPDQFKEVVFTQLGQDPIFDWSIAELEFFN